MTPGISLSSFYKQAKLKFIFFRPNFRRGLGHCAVLVEDTALKMTLLKQGIVILYILEYKVDWISID